jgi:hypothetical protein
MVADGPGGYVGGGVPKQVRLRDAGEAPTQVLEVRADHL